MIQAEASRKTGGIPGDQIQVYDMYEDTYVDMVFITVFMKLLYMQILLPLPSKVRTFRIYYIYVIPSYDTFLDFNQQQIEPVYVFAQLISHIMLIYDI